MLREEKRTYWVTNLSGLRVEPASTDFVISIMTLITAKYGVFANPGAFIPPTGIKQGFKPNEGELDKGVHFSRNFIIRCI